MDTEKFDLLKAHVADEKMTHPDGHEATISGGTLTIKHGAAK